MATLSDYLLEKALLLKGDNEWHWLADAVRALEIENDELRAELSNLEALVYTLKGNDDETE